MDFSASNLFAGLVFGSFGLSFFRLGKKRGHPMAIVAGTALMIFPYFVENIYLMWGIGLVLLYFGWNQIKG
jgi:hypothetical protein